MRGFFVIGMDTEEDVDMKYVRIFYIGLNMGFGLSLMNARAQIRKKNMNS
jgi:hypothetical protein